MDSEVCYKRYEKVTREIIEVNMSTEEYLSYRKKVKRENEGIFYLSMSVMLMFGLLIYLSGIT